MAIKLAFPNLVPGPTFAYFFAALLLAFVIRPILDSASFKKTNSESGRDGRIAPATPPTPPGMRVRTGRFQSDSGAGP